MGKPARPSRSNTTPTIVETTGIEGVVPKRATTA
jgi:hypothetical protein